MELYDIFRNEINLDNIYENMDYLVNQVGERLSGSQEMTKATEYINSKLQEYGIDSHIDHFPMYQSYPGEATLKITEPFEKEIKTRPVCHIKSTGEEGISGELLYLGSGRYEDYEGKDYKDKIILTDMNWSPGRPEKARIAWELGAKALIIMNWGKADSDLIQMGGVKTQWGNPTPDDVKDIVELPVISISRRDGEALVELCKSSNVKVWLKAYSTREWITASQPIGVVKGTENSGQYVLVGSHVDAWGKSAICNASGDSMNLELARICYQHRDELKRDVVFTFWDGHEIAECGGSTWYCDNNWSKISKGCMAYINIDNLAIKGTTVPGVEGQPEMKDFLMGAIKEIWKQDGVWHQAYKGGGDSSFFGVGVPYISFATEYTEDMLKELNYAFYSPWLHSDSDTLDKLDRNLLQKHAEYISYVLSNLVNNSFVPYDLIALANDVKHQWEKVMAEAGIAKVMIEDLDKTVDKYVDSLYELGSIKENAGDSKEKIEQYNKLAILCERQTAMFRCYSGRYGQDGCCALQTENPMPALDKALKKYNDAEPDSFDHYLWETQVLRVKNMIYDSLADTINFIELGLAK